MADPKKVARGKSLIERVLAKVPAEKKANVTALLEIEDVLEEVGADGLRQDEFSRAMNEAQTKETKAGEWKANLDGWWKDKQTEITNLQVENALLKERLEKGGGGGAGAGGDDGGNGGAGGEGGTRSTMPDLTSYVKKDEVEKTVATRVAQAAADVVPLVSTLNRLTLQHFKDFNEVLDIDGLIEHSRKTQTPIDRGAYESFVKDKLDAKKEADEKTKIEAAEKRGEERARAALGSAQPYPVANAEPSTLDGLDKTKQHGGVDAAVNLFNKLVSGTA